MLGVTPNTPGFTTWAVAPQPGSVSWAQGTVPTPHGTIAVGWRRGAGRSFRLTVIAPGGTSGVVAVPVAGLIARDGRVVWSHGHAASGVHARRRGRAVVFDVGPGATTFAAIG